MSIPHICSKVPTFQNTLPLTLSTLKTAVRTSNAISMLFIIMFTVCSLLPQ